MYSSVLDSDTVLINFLKSLGMSACAVLLLLVYFIGQGTCTSFSAILLSEVYTCLGHLTYCLVQNPCAWRSERASSKLCRCALQKTLVLLEVPRCFSRP
jgi:hypothetical protein